MIKKYFKKQSSLTKILLITLICLIFTGVFIEISTRVFIFFKYGSTTYGQHWKFEYEPFLMFKSTDVMHKEYPKKTDKFRIVLLGGSTAQQIPKNLAENCFNNHLGKNVEFINLGNNGYILNQEVIMLALYGLKLKPDLIISLDGANDIVTVSRTGKYGVIYADQLIYTAIHKPFINAILSVLRHSQFINGLNILRERKIEKKVQTDSLLITKTIEHIMEGLSTISTMARGDDIPYMMILQPYVHFKKNLTNEENNVYVNSHLYRKNFMMNTFNLLHKNMSAHNFGDKVLYLNASECFKDSNENCFKDEVHLTKTGNKILLNYIATKYNAHIN